MKYMVDIQHIEVEFTYLTKKVIKKIIKKSLRRDVNLVQMRVLFVNNELSQEYNLLYRQKNYPTNVISLEDRDALEKFCILSGEVILCEDVIIQEATAQNKDILAHYIHMLVHGLLHMQGFDHVFEKDAEKMEAIEVTILKEFGIKNPYTIAND